MRFIILLIFFLCVGLNSTAFSEYYKYVNQEGVVCFTDDLSQVPEKQRTNLKKIKEIVSDSGSKAEPKIQDIVQGKSDEVNDKTLIELKKMGNALDKEFSELNAERERLIAMQNNSSTEEDIAQFNIQANELNKKVIEYKEKKATYLKKVKAYNKL